jgi:membrane protein implicated in regulation of membrane protease activity
MAESTLWWIGTGLLVAVELATGTFYLLMVAIGLAAGASQRTWVLGLTTQLVVSALVGGGAVALWYVRRQRHPQALAAGANPDVNLDIGETVLIDHWQPTARPRVKYRGASWTVVHRSGMCPAPAPTVSSKSSAAAWWSTRSRNGPSDRPLPAHPSTHGSTPWKLPAS